MTLRRLPAPPARGFVTHEVHPQARAIVLRTPPAEHGGSSGEAQQPTPGLLDFSVCLNAYGPAAVVRDAVRHSDLTSYPDPLCRAARGVAATHWGRPEDEIVLGAGAAELIQAVCFAYLDAGDKVIVPEPAFGEYARAARLCGAQIMTHTLSVHDTEAVVTDRLHALARVILREAPRLVFLATPTSPWGLQLPLASIANVAGACATAGALLVLDQAYDAFAEEPLGTPALADHSHVLHLRSLTKEHALAGIRVAFAVGPRAVVRAIESVRVPWACSAPAQAAAVTSFHHDAVHHVESTTRLLRESAGDIAAHCASIGLPVVSHHTHFLLVNCGNASTAKSRLRESYSVLVRNCGSFGLPQHIRVAARLPRENDVLKRALSSLVATGELHHNSIPSHD